MTYNVITHALTRQTSYRGLIVALVALLKTATLFALSLSAFAAQLKDFDAEYAIYYGDFKLGEGEYHLRRKPSGLYAFSFHSEMQFLIFSDRREVSSELNIINGQAVPNHYQHKREGTGKDYLDEIIFDVESGIIKSSARDDFQEFDYDAQVKDALTAQLQLFLDLRKGSKSPSYMILESNKIKRHYFEFIRQETIRIKDQAYNTVVYQVVRDKKKRRTVMWFSVDHQYQPVKMVHFDRDKKKFNAELSAFNFLSQ